MKDREYSVLHEKLTQELRRGVLVIATLSQLEQAKYGYALIEELSKKGLDIDQGTLYPLLRRLEEQGLLESEWNVEGSRPRRYYKISTRGEEILLGMTADWRKLVAVIEELLVEG
jgi:PadR family transcriptional regulator PadR